MSTGNSFNWFGVITLFPELFEALTFGITGRALKKKQIMLELFNPRDFSAGKRKNIDDKPYGGGPGMIMLVEPLIKAIHKAKEVAPSPPTVVYLSPQGKCFNQPAAKAFSYQRSLILIAGRYDGIDERVIETEVDSEWSIGDYILSGGELPAMVFIDAITRLIPSVLGNSESAEKDSFSQTPSSDLSAESSLGILKYPQYSRPELFQGNRVPDVLLSGNHQEIAKWREAQSIARTLKRRPDLMVNLESKSELTKKK